MIGTKILEERESKFNGHLKVVRSLGFGTYIQAEGLTQSGGIVEAIWKSTLRKIHRSPFTVHRSLILGLGGGTVAKLIRKNWPDSKITGVDIDPIMIELGKKYLGLDQAIVDIKITDALKFLSVHRSRFTDCFDLVIVDLYSGDKFPEKFETDDCIKLVRCHLASNGIAIFNRLYYGDKRPEAVKFGNKLKKIFSNVEWFYPEANLMFLCHK
jgi:spermidine synthase